MLMRGSTPLIATVSTKCSEPCGPAGLCICYGIQFLRVVRMLLVVFVVVLVVAVLVVVVVVVLAVVVVVLGLFVELGHLHVVQVADVHELVELGDLDAANTDCQGMFALSTHRQTGGAGRLRRRRLCQAAPGAGGAPPGPAGRKPRFRQQKPLFRNIFPEVASGAHNARPAQCAPDATSGKSLFLGRFGGPVASAPLGGRQGTLGPAPVHFGRGLRTKAAPGGWRGVSLTRSNCF